MTIAADDLLQTYFKKGSDVEISSNDEGFRNSWFSGTVVRVVNKRSKTEMEQQVVVEYKTLMEDESGKKPLRETVNVVQLRPPPPRETHRNFKVSEEVDAFYNDGWWEGVVMEVLEGGKYSVYFRGTKEKLIISQSELRLHREWANGIWRPPLVSARNENGSMLAETKPLKQSNEHFSKGTLVEVSSDEEGFQGAWFAATVLRELENGDYLIEYQYLRNEGDTELLQEVIDHLHIRPYPPEIVAVENFKLLEEVDALYNDGWWVGVISKVLRGQKYLVYFRGTNEEMEFKQSDLRLHQDWINGQWVIASQALKL